MSALNIRTFALPLLLCATFGHGVVSFAQESEELITDRPDQTESAATVPQGSVQVEVGWLSEHDEEGGIEADLDAIGGTLVRIGLAPRLELRLGWDGYLDGEVAGFDFDGSGDGEVGLKYVLRPSQGNGPQIALLVSSTVPIGDDALTSDEYDPSFRFLFDQDLTDNIGLGYNVGIEWATEGGPGGETTLSTAVYTLAVGFGLTPRWGAFVEIFGDVPLSAEGDGTVSLDGGFTYLVRDNLQLDFAGGVGLNDEAPDWFVGVGVSFRLPR